MMHKIKVWRKKSRTKRFGNSTRLRPGTKIIQQNNLFTLKKNKGNQSVKISRVKRRIVYVLYFMSLCFVYQCFILCVFVLFCFAWLSINCVCLFFSISCFQWPRGPSDHHLRHYLHHRHRHHLRHQTRQIS
jgi:hypothetical protein